MNKNISICGSNCEVCYCYTASICKGCNAHCGKVFHCPNDTACPIYHCCVNVNGYENCLTCEKLPCNIWKQTRDPKYSDEEFEQNIKDRIKQLKQLVHTEQK